MIKRCPSCFMDFWVEKNHQSQKVYCKERCRWAFLKAKKLKKKQDEKAKLAGTSEQSLPQVQ